MDSDLEKKLKSLIYNIAYVFVFRHVAYKETISNLYSLVNLIRELDLEWKPESEFMSLITRLKSVFNSMDLDSQPEPLSELVSAVSKVLVDYSKSDMSMFEVKSSTYLVDSIDTYLRSLVKQTMRLVPEPEIVSIVYQISLGSINNKLICLCPQVKVRLEEEKFHVTETVLGITTNRWDCLTLTENQTELTLRGDYRRDVFAGYRNRSHFFCQLCNGKGHEESEKAPIEIKHPLHPDHSLKLVMFIMKESETRKCYCGDEDIKEFFYYCYACDFAINLDCAEKQPLLEIDHPKWHCHKLQLFPRKSSLVCNLCGVPCSTPYVYMCPPCDFMVHESCTSLPRVIKISRHLHRLAFTFSFERGDRSCSICRKKIDNIYGGFSCIKDNCSYTTHSRCGTQSNVWDGIDLYGVPEDIEEEVPGSFIRISDGVIQHFTHQHHHLKLDENTERDYDDNKLCQICMDPIYFGNLYSCTQCEYILHEKCANLSRLIQHPIHPHKLTLALADEPSRSEQWKGYCSACNGITTIGFTYKCNTEECGFSLHITCATINEPLVHGSHKDPLFLTSKPGEKRRCSICPGRQTYKETFNCLECDFSLCYGCASIPEKMRYKHDKHILTLAYGKETGTTTYWCEICEKRIRKEERFYKCDEYCCVTLHMTCLIGKDFQHKPGSVWYHRARVVVLANNQHMTRPFCSTCGKRCLRNVLYLYSHGNLCCSKTCVANRFP